MDMAASSAESGSADQAASRRPESTSDSEGGQFTIGTVPSSTAAGTPRPAQGDASGESDATVEVPDQDEAFADIAAQAPAGTAQGDGDKGGHWPGK